ncbi:hypothetical protein ACFL3S_01515 [Gemmatimonadota bacterium]
MKGSLFNTKAGEDLEPTVLIVLACVWMAASSATGFLLALLAHRIHPAMSLVKLWFFYTVLMGAFVAVVLLVGWS